jgi:hypothetical protein
MNLNSDLKFGFEGKENLTSFQTSELDFDSFGA